MARVFLSCAVYSGDELYKREDFDYFEADGSGQCCYGVPYSDSSERYASFEGQTADVGQKVGCKFLGCAMLPLFYCPCCLLYVRLLVIGLIT